VIKNLVKEKAKTVIGIDASTNSLAYAKFQDGEPVRCGEIKFEGKTLFERLYDAKKKTRALVEQGVLKADFIAIEAAWSGPNPKTGLDLAYVYGAIISELMASPRVVTVKPLEWQTYIGNPNLKKEEKDALVLSNPEASKSVLQSKGRELRKLRTLQFARGYFKIPSGSDNVGDAVGVAVYALEVLTTTK
jgi:Holliday junction resolvasome RuvABC endonuclease subunit